LLAAPVGDACAAFSSIARMEMSAQIAVMGGFWPRLARRRKWAMIGMEHISLPGILIKE
jgi:hypothetical protein